MFDDLTEAELLARLEASLLRMPARRRAIFLAVRLESASYSELAERNELTVRQVEREFVRALLQLDDAVRRRPRVPRWRRCFRLVIGRIRF